MSMFRSSLLAGLTVGLVSASAWAQEDEPVSGATIVVESVAEGGEDGGPPVVATTQAFAFDTGSGAPIQIMMAPGAGISFGGALGGAGQDPYGLLSDDQVRGELGLGDDQWKDIQGIQQEFQNRMRETTQNLMQGGFNPEKAKEMKGAIESVRTEMVGRLNDVLLPHQQKRLEQLGRHVAIKTSDLGQAFFEGPLADALELSEEDRERLRTRSTEIQEELDAEVKRLTKEAREKLLNELTSSQRETLQDLLGDEFDYQPRDIRSEMRRMRDDARRRRTITEEGEAGTESSSSSSSATDRD